MITNADMISAKCEFLNQLERVHESEEDLPLPFSVNN